MKERDKARCFGQDLMRGEHRVGGGRAVKNEIATSYKSQGRLTALQRTGSSRVDTTPGGGGGAYLRRDANGDAVSVYADGPEAMQQTGTSIFDPVLCELMYSWFTAPGHLVLDPFAGGSVRGIVASVLGRRYVGVDLRPEQAAANERQAVEICSACEHQPRWLVGDSIEITALSPEPCDFLFSCPPYGDLERYSDDERDLSTMEHGEFLRCYRQIIAASASLLKPNRFACFVVGDFRGEDGFYKNFVSETIMAFHVAGLRLYNEAILITAVGSLPVRAGRAFEAGRKLGKTHQNILVFCKGSWREAAKACKADEKGEGGSA